MSPRELTASDTRTPGAESEAPEPLPPAAASPQVVAGDFPLESPGFRPRVGLLAELDRAGTRVTVIHAATGMLGAGTTQLAAATARAKLEADWRLVAWVNAADTSSLQAGLAAVADAAGLTEGDSGRRSADPGRAVRHLLETDGNRRLLVFNDASDLEVLQPFLPAAGSAQVLITSIQPPTVDPTTASLVTAVPVDVFGAEEARSFLTERTGLDDAAGAAAVADVLGHLPLPLALAVPSIRGQRHGYSRYLDQLQTMPAAVFLTTDDGHPYPNGVARAVLLSLAAVRAADQTGMCTRAIEIMSVLSAAGVRRELLHVAGRAGVLASGGHRVEAAVVDRVLGWLSARSLLTFSLDGETVMMPRLVAQVVRDGLARRWRLGAVCFVAASVLEGHAIAVAGSQDRPAVRGISQQVTALLSNTAVLAGERDAELAELLLRLRFIALYHLIELGDSTPQAIAVGEALTADLERQLGPGHPDTLNSRNSLAAAYLAAGRVADAIPLFERTAGILQRQLGADHPDTLTSQNNLASAYQDAGRLAEAIQLYEQNLAVRERLLGADHASTLTSRGNLAAAYLAAGRMAEAVTLLEQTLAGRERVLGPDHPDTQTSRKNLAAAHRASGRPEATPSAEPAAAAPDPERQVPDEDVTQVLPAILRRPPAGSARQVRPGGMRRPPSGSAGQGRPAGLRRPPSGSAGRLLSDRHPGPSAEAGEHASPDWTHDLPPIDPEHDRFVVASITAGDPAGMGLAYDTYAPALYGYCHWMLHDPAGAAESLQDTFVISAATLNDLPDPAKLRPWLFALARSEVKRRIRPGAVTRDEADAVDQRADGGQRTDEVGRPDGAMMQFPAVTESVGGPDGPTVLFRPGGEPVSGPVSAPDGPAVPLPPVGDPDGPTMLFPKVSGPAGGPDGPTVLFRPAGGPVSEPAGGPVSEPVGGPDGPTVLFRRVGEPDDATVLFRRLTEPEDSTVLFRRLTEPDDSTVMFRADREPIPKPNDATMSFLMVSQPADATMQFRALVEPATVTESLPDVDGYLGQAELRALIRSILADLKPREREVIELSFRHELQDDDLAIVLGVSSNRAHLLAARARGRLEKSFGALRTVLAGREACPVVGELLADWDGQLTEQTRDLVAWHIEQCQTCAHHGRDALRPTALSGLLPLAPLPPELRQQVLSRCFATDEAAAAYRRRVVRRAKSTWSAAFSQAARRMSWDSVRANPGAAIATTAVAVWVAVAVIVTLLTFAGSGAAHAQEPRPSARTSSIRPATVSASANGRASAKALLSPAVSRPPTHRPSPAQPALLPSSYYSPRLSPSPTPSKSKSPSPSPSPTPSKTPSKSPSPTATA